jgi:hypothetical protein
LQALRELLFFCHALIAKFYTQILVVHAVKTDGVRFSVQMLLLGQQKESLDPLKLLLIIWKK